MLKSELPMDITVFESSIGALNEISGIVCVIRSSSSGEIPVRTIICFTFSKVVRTYTQRMCSGLQIGLKAKSSTMGLTMDWAVQSKRKCAFDDIGKSQDQKRSNDTEAMINNSFDSFLSNLVREWWRELILLFARFYSIFRLQIPTV